MWMVVSRSQLISSMLGGTNERDGKEREKMMRRRGKAARQQTFSFILTDTSVLLHEQLRFVSRGKEKGRRAPTLPARRANT